MAARACTAAAVVWALLVSPFPVPAAAEAARPAAPEESAVLAVVGGRPITFADLRRGAAPGVATREELRARLDALVLEESLAAVARAEGYEQREEVRRAVDRLLAARYRAERLEPRLQSVTVAEEEVAAWYAAHPAEFAVPRRVRGAVVLVAVPRKADARTRAAKRAKAEGALEAARRLPPATPGFGPVAAEVSDDRATRYAGGDTGWLEEAEAVDRWGAETARALFSLGAPGALAPLVETPEGFALVKLTEERPAAARPLDEVREAVRRRLLVERQGAVERAFAAEVARQAGAVVDEALLERELARADEEALAGRGAKPPALPGVPAGPER